jgi:hypothetical protein
MKKLLVASAIGLTAIGALAQGQFNFCNRVLASAIDAPVLNELGAPAAAGYFAQAYAGSTATSLTPVGVAVEFRTDRPDRAGYINPVPVTVPGIATGAKAFVEMRAWKGQVGGTVYTSYDAALNGGVYGKSNPVELTLGGGTVTPTDMVGLQAFNMVPEPSALALGVLGVAALLLRRRS